jgi:glucose/arabinose dehydrogenase
MVFTPWIIVTGTLLASWLAPAWCRAEGFPAPFNSEKDAAAEPLPAAEAAAAMDVPTGFHVGVFAAEPDVQNPIAMAWDPRGRLWIAENHTYAERPIKMDTRLRDRVLIFADRDGDGTADERKVFLDDLEQLTSVEVGLGGVWLMCPPRLLFVPDRNGDDVPDGPAKVVLDGFEVATENYHNFANGLRFGPDGWLYGRCGGLQTARSLASATCCRDIRRPTGSDAVAAASPRGLGRTASSTSRLLSFSTGLPISSRRRGSTGIAITEYLRRITGCGKPSRRWRSGTSAGGARL